MRLWLVSLGLLPILMVGSGPGAIASTPAPPPQNGLIALTAPQGIQLVDPQSARSWTVPDTTDMGEPAWSPDGEFLAVESWARDSDVYVLRPDGSDRRLVLRDAWTPSWSPDGKRLVVARSGEGGSVLFTVDVDGGNVRQITSEPHVSGPVWSPDGRWIAFTDGEGAVKLVAATGEADGLRMLADDGVNLAWSPDSSSLAFDAFDTSGNDVGPYVAVVDVTTGNRSELRPRRFVSALAWSPDGKEIAFFAGRPHTSESGCGQMPMDLWAANVDGSNPRLLEKDVYAKPSWGTFLPESKPTT